MVVSVVSLTFGFIDSRSVQIDKYSDQIGIWNDLKRAEFANLKISALYETNEVILLEQSQDPNMIKQDAYTTLPSNYTPLFYYLSSYNSKAYNKTDLLKIRLSITEGTGNATQIDLPPVQVFKRTESSLLRGSCKAIGGNYEILAKCVLHWVKVT